jgi:RNA binding exosome subunit
LSSNVPIAYVDIRAFIHATEDLEKVTKALQNILPPDLMGILAIRKTELTGHHGNPITLLEARIKGRRTAQAFLGKLASSLRLIDKETLGSEIASHLEKGNLYLRLDKQAAFLGEFKLGSTDSIHIRMHFRKPGSEDVIKICRRFGLLP